MNSAANCSICHNEPSKEHQMIALPCGCQPCSVCMVQWIITKLKEFRAGIQCPIYCPVYDCYKSFKIEDIFNFIPPNERSEMEDILLKTYLAKAPDVQMCPKLGCSYAVVVNRASLCSRELTCEVCGTKWNNEQRRSGILRRLLRKIINFKNEVFFYFWRISKNTNKCPRCKVLIFREHEYCADVTCTQCGCNFCWYCFSEPDCEHRPTEHWQVNPKCLFFALACFVLLAAGGGYLAYWGIKAAIAWLL